MAELNFGRAGHTLFKPQPLETILDDLGKVWNDFNSEAPAELPANAYTVTYEL